MWGENHMSLIDEIRNDVTGAAVLADWLGDGLNPVDQKVADARAAVCLTGNGGGECPHLKSPNWWDNQKGNIAFAIKEQLEAKSKMKLATELDATPRMCSICGCCMPLKAWVPIKHVAAHTSEDLVKKFVPWCWQRIEIENL